MGFLVFAATVFGLLAALAVPATAQSPPAGLSARTAAVLRASASSNVFEIESSRLALARSQSTAIKEFADRMVVDHTRAANRTRQVLGEIGASPPPAVLEQAHQQQLDALTATQNAQFDNAYVEAQYIVHIEAIALLRDYASTGDNERLKALAAQGLALLQTHLDHVTRLKDGALPR